MFPMDPVNPANVPPRRIRRIPISTPYFDVDTDGDGIPNIIDPAPFDPNVPYIDRSPGAGGPYGDHDGDGIPNYKDPQSPFYVPIPPYNVPGKPFPYGVPFPAHPDINPLPLREPGGPFFPELISTGADGEEGEMPYPGYPYLPKPYSTPDDAPPGSPSNPYPVMPDILDPFKEHPDYPYPEHPDYAPHYKRHRIPGLVPTFNNDPFRGRRAEVEGESRMSY